MDVTLDHLLALAFGRLGPADSALVRATIEQSPELASAFARFTILAKTVQADLLDPIPPAAIQSAKDLGRRLEALRSPSMLERAGEAIRGLVARLVFDSRLDGPIVGLRGGTGFVLSYELESTTAGGPATDLEIECSQRSDDIFQVVGQITRPSAVAMATLNPWARGRVIAQELGEANHSRFEAEIDDHGMFRFTLAAGAYRLRLETPSAHGPFVELAELELP
jgi:hypothetical protein